MGHRAAILGKLGCAQIAHIFDALHPARLHIGRKFLITKNGQPLFQRQLEPVTAGHPVAAPVMEIFMGNHRFDSVVIIVSSGLRSSKDIAGVENIEPLVFHGSHIKIIDRYDHIAVKVIFPAINIFIPAHRLFEGAHGVIALAAVLLVHIDPQRHFPTGAGSKTVFNADEIAGHQCKQIARLSERIMPDCKVTAVRHFTLRREVAVGEQHRITVAIGNDCGGKERQNIGTVRIIGDGAKPFRLALSAEHP